MESLPTCFWPKDADELQELHREHLSEEFYDEAVAEDPEVFREFVVGSWSDAAEMLSYEKDLLGQLEKLSEDEWDRWSDDNYEDWGLSTGGQPLGTVAIATCLEALGCIVFDKSNACMAPLGEYPPCREDDNPYVFFYAPSAAIPAIVAAVTSADVSVAAQHDGLLLIAKSLTGFLAAAENLLAAAGGPASQVG